MINQTCCERMQAFPTTAQRVLNFDTDLSDGLALGALLLSHIPQLAFLAAQLDMAPTTPTALQNNANTVVKMTVEIQLPWRLQVSPVQPCCLLQLHLLQLPWT